MKTNVEVMKKVMKKSGTRKTDTCPDKRKKKDDFTRIERKDTMLTRALHSAKIFS